MTEALAPTPEQLAKFTYEAPRRDQTVNRTAYRRRSPLDNLWDRGEITHPMHLAAQKLDYHHKGAQGVRVQYGEDTGLNTDTEYPRTYHAQKLALAEEYVLPSEWWALTNMIEETKTLEEIGRGIRSVSRREIARQAGLGAVSSGLERLALLWGFLERQKVPIR
jgi:hypothetical protein